MKCKLRKSIKAAILCNEKGKYFTRFQRSRRKQFHHHHHQKRVSLECYFCSNKMILLGFGLTETKRKKQEQKTEKRKTEMFSIIQLASHKLNMFCQSNKRHSVNFLKTELTDFS